MTTMMKMTMTATATKIHDADRYVKGDDRDVDS